MLTFRILHNRQRASADFQFSDQLVLFSFLRFGVFLIFVSFFSLLNEDGLNVILVLEVGASGEAGIQVEGKAGSGRR